MPKPDCVPLIVDRKEESPLPVVADTVSKQRGFMFQRLTYYWIVFISQSLQIGLSLVGFVVANAKLTPTSDDDDLELIAFAGSATYSFITLLILYVVFRTHFKKYPDAGVKKITAIHHVNIAKCCVMMSFFNLGVFFSPIVIKYAEGDGSKDIRAIVVPINVSLLLVSASASAIAGYITYTVAKRARGTDLVPDPNHRVPAWSLATTAESAGFPVENGVQLA